MEDDDLDGYTQMVMDAMGPTIFNSASFEPNPNSNSLNEQPPNPSAKGFYDMLAAADEPLGDGCQNYLKLQIVSELLNWKSENNTSKAIYVKKMAKDMMWHFDHQTQPGIMVHPSDGKAWKHFDSIDPQFTSEIRNMGLKESYVELSMLIPRKKSLGQNIDVFLRPLVEELITLYNDGIETYDAERKENSIMKDVPFWTVSDFPAYAMLSGWSTHGKLACPYCMGNSGSFQLEHGGKPCWFDGHQNFLPSTHPYRKDKRGFIAANVVLGGPPLELNGDQIWEQIRHYPTVYEANPYRKTNQKLHGFGRTHNWKNVFENLFNTIMGTAKMKDNVKARKDVKKYCNRAELHIHQVRTKDMKPKASYTLTKPQVELSTFFRAICARVLHTSDLILLQQSIVETICMLEKNFPLDSLTQWNTRTDSRLSIFKVLCRRLYEKSGRRRSLSDEEKCMAHNYIILNCEELHPFIGLFDDSVRYTQPQLDEKGLESYRDKKFAECSDDSLSHLKGLARGPLRHAWSYKGYFINGFKFYMEKYEEGRVTHNSGVCVKGACYNETECNLYGLLEEVVEVAYCGVGHCVVILFKCKWFDATQGVRINNKHNIVDIKYKSRLINDEPFVLASQVEQVYYAPYPLMTKDLKDWWVVVKTKSRSMYELKECENEEDGGDNADEDEFFQESKTLILTASRSLSEIEEPVCLVIQGELELVNNNVIMARTNVRRGGRGGRGGGGGDGHGLSDHEAARGWGQISIQTNTSGTCSKTNATISADTGVQKSVHTNTSRTRYETNVNTSGTRSETNASTSGTHSMTNENTSGTRSETNANISSNTGVQKSVQTNTSCTHYETNANTSDANTSGSRSETNTGVQKSIRNNTSGTRSETNATMSHDTGVQEPVGEDGLNMDVSQRQRGSNIIEQVPQDPSKMTMISLDGGEFTEPKVVRKITSILRTMFNGSWTTWKEVDKSGRDELWAHFKELFKWEGLSDVLVHDAWENSMKKRYLNIMSKARNESVKLAKAAGTSTQMPPTTAELFEFTHTKNEAFITSKSKRVAATYNGALVEKYRPDPANHPIYDDDLSKKCAGDDMKGGVFGWGSIVHGELKEELKEEVKVDLKKEMKVDLKEEMKADLKEEIKNELKEEMREELKE
uniref:DUF4216 domain-containing protein n=1 Tax=Tanacetum cinerariifolium TaxID=118510 RepID=A0A6L2KGU1_TANCI|nr:hypothetical protein [Tanacetum cinerariifolium]